MIIKIKIKKELIMLKKVKKKNFINQFLKNMRMQNIKKIIINLIIAKNSIIKILIKKVYIIKKKKKRYPYIKSQKQVSNLKIKKKRQKI